LLTLQPDKRFIDITKPQQTFKVGSRVQFGKPEEYGVITWIGIVHGEECVQVNMVSFIGNVAIVK